MKVIDLGWCMARINTKLNSLVIVSPAAVEEQTYQPAESVCFYGKENIEKLRDALNEAYPVTSEGEHK